MAHGIVQPLIDELHAAGVLMVMPSKLIDLMRTTLNLLQLLRIKWCRGNLPPLDCRTQISRSHTHLAPI